MLKSCRPCVIRLIAVLLIVNDTLGSKHGENCCSRVIHFSMISIFANIQWPLSLDRCHYAHNTSGRMQCESRPIGMAMLSCAICGDSLELNYYMRKRHQRKQMSWPNVWRWLVMTRQTYIELTGTAHGPSTHELSVCYQEIPSLPMHRFHFRHRHHHHQTEHIQCRCFHTPYTYRDPCMVNLPINTKSFQQNSGLSCINNKQPVTKWQGQQVT